MVFISLSCPNHVSKYSQDTEAGPCFQAEFSQQSIRASHGKIPTKSLEK